MTSPAERPAERRRLQHREDARRTILDATEDLIVERGYEHFSMRRLAERCGYTPPTIYHYFGDKRGLIDALLEERYRVVVEQANQVGPFDDPVRTLHALTESFIRFGIANPDHHRLLAAPRPDDSPPPAAAEELQSLIERPLAELAAAGRLRAADVEEAMQAIWVLIHGLVSTRVNRPDYAWSPTLDDFALDALLRGLVRQDSQPNDARPTRSSP